MRLTKVVLACVLSLACLMAKAGDTTLSDSSKVSYANHIYSGGLFGKSKTGVTASFSFVNGVRYKRVFAGIGIGYDDYSRQSGYYYNQFPLRWKTMPVFASVAFDFAKLKGGSFFVQMNGGYSWMWASGDFDVPMTESKGGLMINPTIGYRIIAGKFAMTISGGYKWQKHQYQLGDQWGWGRLDVSETFEKASLQIGFGLH